MKAFTFIFILFFTSPAYAVVIPKPAISDDFYINSNILTLMHKENKGVIFSSNSQIFEREMEALLAPRASIFLCPWRKSKTFNKIKILTSEAKIRILSDYGFDEKLIHEKYKFQYNCKLLKLLDVIELGLMIYRYEYKPKTSINEKGQTTISIEELAKREYPNLSKRLLDDYQALGEWNEPTIPYNFTKYSGIKILPWKVNSGPSKLSYFLLKDIYDLSTITWFCPTPSDNWKTVHIITQRAQSKLVDLYNVYPSFYNRIYKYQRECKIVDPSYLLSIGVIPK